MFDTVMEGQQRSADPASTGGSSSTADVLTIADTPGECYRPIEELLAPEELVASLAGSRNLADHAVVDMIANVIGSGEWCVSGINSIFHWVEWQMGLTRHHAGRLVRIAERRSELPFAFDRFSEGQLSIDQMGLIAKHCPTNYDETVSGLAVHAMIPQLRRILRDYRFPDPEPEPEPEPDPDPDPEPADDPPGEPEGESDSTFNDNSGQSDSSADGSPDPTDGLSLPDSSTDNSCPSDMPDGFVREELDKPYRGFGYGFDDDGNFRMWMRCGADDGAEISAAMDQARARLKADTAETDVSGFDAFLTMIRAGVESDPSGSRGADNRVLVHLEASELIAWVQGFRPNLHLGPVLTSDVMELLTCESSVQLLLTKFGKPVSLGLSQAAVPPWLREIILNRDNGCRFPGCSSQRWLDVHHMKHWAKGGRTDTNNLVCLCRRHHREHHRHAFSIEGDPEVLFGAGSSGGDGLRFIASGGREIRKTDPVPDAPPEGNYAHALGESYDGSLVHFPRNEPHPNQNQADPVAVDDDPIEDPPPDDAASEIQRFLEQVAELAATVPVQSKPENPGAP